MQGGSPEATLEGLSRATNAARGPRSGSRGSRQRHQAKRSSQTQRVTIFAKQKIRHGISGIDHYVGYSHPFRYSRDRSFSASASPITISFSPSQRRLRPSLRDSMPRRLMLVE